MINWLISQARKVYDWFGASYWSLRDAIGNISGAISRGINTAISAVKSWVSGVVDGIRSWVTEAWQNVKAWAIEAINSASNFLTNLIKSIESGIRGFIASVDKTIRSWVQGISNSITDWTSGLIGGVQRAIEGVKDWYARLQDNVSNITKLLSNWSKVFTSTILKNITVFFTKMFDFFLSLWTDPVGQIFNFIWGQFVDFVCYSIAYALGSTKTQLPPIPKWGKGSPSTVIIGDAEPGELHNPLDHLYISGYTFTSTHKGIDLGLVCGAPVYAMHGGTVIESGMSSVGYGITVVISSGKWWSRYGHLSSSYVQVGQAVNGGDQIGIGDSTGNSTGCHLHLEIKENGGFIDPATVLGL